MTSETSVDPGLARRLVDTAAKIEALYSAGVPAVVAVDGPLFERDEVFGWIAAAHAPEHENVAADKIRALRQAWGMPGAQDRARPVDPGRPAEVYTPGAMLLDAHPWLPRATEPFDAWVTRVRSGVGRFGMQAPGIECASWDALHRLQTLLAPVLRTTGPRTHRYNAFVGDYERTPFGFHIDAHQEAVFQYVLHGRRRALFWEGRALGPADAAWLEDTNGLTEPPRPPDFVFDLGPGDLVFWPGTAVHGMEPDGPSMALSMVVDRTSPRTRDEVVSSLSCSTAGGAAALPEVGEPPLVTPTSTFVRRGVFPIAYERIDDVLIVGVCGRTFDWPDVQSAGAAMRLFDALNADAVAMKTLIAECCSDVLPGDLACEVVGMLVGLGFLAEA